MVSGVTPTGKSEPEASEVHPVILAPMSRYWADRFWNGAKRSPIARTSWIDGERPSA